MDLSQYKAIVGYGIGQFYDYIKKQIPQSVNIDYLCDAKWQQIGKEYDGIPVISPEELEKMQDVFVIVFSGNARNLMSISGMLQKMNLPYMHADKMIQAKKSITGKELKQIGKSPYIDANNNKVYFQDDVEDSIIIYFEGGNNEIHFGKGLSVGELRINCGKNAYCSIGEETAIEECTIFVSDGKVTVGKHCLFSYKVILRNHDGHCIFDKRTGKRINYAGNISIGNHVWIGYHATLLGNATIGDNSVVGTMAVTSSTFPKEVVIAGNPAKIIREEICWSKDNVTFYDRENLDECLAKEAYLYM